MGSLDMKELTVEIMKFDVNIEHLSGMATNASG